MSYNKKTWAAKDKITSAALNNIEGGVYDITPLDIPVTLTVGEGGAVTGSTTAVLADIKTAYLAGIPIQATIALPSSSGIVHSKLKFVDDDTDPGTFGFSEVLDLHASGSPAAPTLYQIVITDVGVAVTAETLAIAT